MRKGSSLLPASLVAIALIGGGWPPGASGEMGPMGGQPLGPMGQMADPTEHGMKTVGGLEITLVSAPPLSREQMAKMMPGMMQGMGGMQGMGAMAGQPTHWIGVVLRDANSDAVVRNLPISLTARKDQWMQTVNLMPMPGSYGANVSLSEKGRYIITITIARAGQPLNVEFPFDYK